ncbi:MAG: aminotransferase class I/II-fold pyridoxal phosphate-dependent enzyme, partial [Duodenibacillus sp.]
MRRPQDTLVRELLNLSGKPEVISFAGGLPASEGFAVRQMRQAADEVLTEMPVRALQYSYTEGDPILRQAIADFETSRGTPTTADEVMIVTGSQQAIDLIARCFIDAGSRIAVENPTYMGALQTFRNVSPVFVPLPHDEEGLNPAAIDASYADVRFAYVMPT